MVQKLSMLKAALDLAAFSPTHNIAFAPARRFVVLSKFGLCLNMVQGSVVRWFFLRAVAKPLTLMGKLITTTIKLRMKNKMRILAILLFAVSITGCSNGNKNSSQEIGNSETMVIDDSMQEKELPKESKLFNDLMSLSQNLNQFEGTAFVGSLDGPCYMVLTSNSQGDNIAKLRYQINNYYQGKADKVDETYTITDLKRKSAKKDGLNLKDTRDFEDTYLYGNVNGLKASINDGAITDGSGSGNIWFVLDSVDYELTYIMASSANWSFQGSIGLEMEQYIKLKELFTDKKLSENEVKSISKSQDLIELSSNDNNFIALGDNKYKVLISKDQLINQSNLTPLFTFTIKNISSRNIDMINLSELYELTPESAYSNAPGSDHGLNPLVYEVFKKSTLGQDNGGSLRLYFSEFKSDKYGNSSYLSENERQMVVNSLSTEVEFTFNLTFDKPGYWFNYRKDEPVNFKELSIAQILNNNVFLDKWKNINKYPAITFKIHDLDRDEWQDIPVEIYFELVD
jgi:hypothetical protein